jgi:hypothetical protein
MTTDNNEFENALRRIVTGAPYLFTPYVPLLQTPVVLDPNQFTRNRIVERYSRERLEQGASYYSRFTFDNFEDVVERAMVREERERASQTKVNWKSEGF